MGEPRRQHRVSRAQLLQLLLLLSLAALPPCACDARPDSSRVLLLRTPGGGIQPQTAVDESGILHLIYYRGDDDAGDVFYTRRPLEGGEFAEAIRVNSQTGSAIAKGSIRGAQLALGARARVHVVWNGSAKAEPRGPDESTPLLYARLGDDGASFEPQRNLITWATGIDGGSTIAADKSGNVYVGWHASAGAEDEAGRSVYLTRSTDDGLSFGREIRAIQEPTGACACCAMRALANESGALYLAYRAARGNLNRDSHLLVSRDRGMHFDLVPIDPWPISACSLSSYALSEGPGGLRMAWETDAKVYFSPLASDGDLMGDRVRAPVEDSAKHPALAVNRRGQTLLAWTEGTAWKRGGSLAWQVYDRDGRPTAERGRRKGVPVWGLVSAFALPDDRFGIVY